MKVTDISGPIYNGMWNYSEPLGGLLGEFKRDSISFDFSGEKYTLDVFAGFKAQTGTYLESPGKHIPGNNYKVSDIAVEKLFMIDAYILNIPYESLGEKDGKRFVSLQDIKKSEKKIIPPGAAILIGTGYGKFWERKDFFSKSWFFKKEAMGYLIEKRPFLLGTDSAEWENPKNPEGIFAMFYPADILILASCINLEKIESFNVKLIVLPFKALNSYICPARAVVVQD
jgi:arylformamidase